MFTSENNAFHKNKNHVQHDNHRHRSYTKPRLLKGYQTWAVSLNKSRLDGEEVIFFGLPACLPYFPANFCKSPQIFLKESRNFWKCWFNAMTSGKFLGFPAIPEKSVNIWGEMCDLDLVSKKICKQWLTIWKNRRKSEKWCENLKTLNPERYRSLSIL